MNYLFYSNYCLGRSGLSNSIMSIELGVIFSFILDRILVIEGNISPQANVVSYTNLNNQYPSAITDLFDIPVPWLNDKQIESSASLRTELFPNCLIEAIFYYPSTLDLNTADFRYFKQGRPYAFTAPENHESIRWLALSGGPHFKERGGLTLYNFGFYSSLFYLNLEWKQRVRALLKGMQPKSHFRMFASSIVRSLGRFNAVHIRRGDFKETPGRSVLLREPKEVLERLDNNFSRNDRLVILTDEAGDPFVQEILKFYPD